MTDKAVKYMIKWVFASMLITLIVLSIVFATEKNFANRFPVKQVTDKLSSIYKSSTNREMKYIGGFIELTIPLHLYNDKYIVVLDTYKHKNIWISEEDLRKNGAMVLGRNKYLMDYYIQSTAPNLKYRPKIDSFMFTVKNAFGQKRDYEMYYSIIPANAEYNY